MSYELRGAPPGAEAPPESAWRWIQRPFAQPPRPAAPPTSARSGAGGAGDQDDWAAQTGELAQAAGWLGCATAVLAAERIAMESGLKPIYQETAAAVRAGLGEDGFQAAWTAGETLSLEEAITYVGSFGFHGVDLET